MPSAEELAAFEARYRARGAAISHDVLAEITTPHIASPDVHVDAVGRRIVMYFHGLEGVGTQVTRVATSRNGIDFEARPEVLGRSYFRVFQHDGQVANHGSINVIPQSTKSFVFRVAIACTP